MSTETIMYRYRIKNLGASSAKYGPCEACGAQASEVHYQVESQRFDDDGREAWTYHECHNLFGHKACLLSARRAPAIPT